jgi:hypothetical protein
MKTGMSPQMAETQAQLTSPAVQASLPRIEELPETQRQELIQAWAALLLHLPEVQRLLEVRHEPVG